MLGQVSAFLCDCLMGVSHVNINLHAAAISTCHEGSGNHTKPLGKGFSLRVKKEQSVDDCLLLKGPSADARDLVESLRVSRVFPPAGNVKTATLPGLTSTKRVGELTLANLTVTTVAQIS